MIFLHFQTAELRANWEDKLSYVSQGFSVVALDYRGQGGQSEDVGGVKGKTRHGHISPGPGEVLAGFPQKILFRQIFLDTAQFAKNVVERFEVDCDRVGVMGGNQLANWLPIPTRDLTWRTYPQKI